MHASNAARELLALIAPVAPATPEAFAASLRRWGRPWTAVELAGPEGDRTSVCDARREIAARDDRGYDAWAGRIGASYFATEDQWDQYFAARETRREAKIAADVAEYAAAYAGLAEAYEAAKAEYTAKRAAIIDALPASLRGSDRATAESLCAIYVRRRASLVRQIRGGAKSPSDLAILDAAY